MVKMILSLMEVKTDFMSDPTKIHQTLMNFHQRMLQLPASQQQQVRISPEIEASNKLI